MGESELRLFRREAIGGDIQRNLRRQSTNRVLCLVTQLILPKFSHKLFEVIGEKNAFKMRAFWLGGEDIDTKWLRKEYTY